MKHAQLSSVCAVFLLGSTLLPGGELRSAVKEKTRIAKEFEGKVALHSTSIKLNVDGEDVDSPMAAVRVFLEQSSRVELHDVYGAPKEGRPAKLARTYEKLAGKASQRYELPDGAEGQAPPEVNKTRSSELEGKTVVFTLGEDGEYKAAFEEGKGDAELLEGLEEDMDLRALLPDHAVEVDKSWTIEAKAFHTALNLPGGDLKLRSEDEKDDSHALNRQMEDNAKGKAKGTFKGLREVEGKKYAVVALEADLETEGERDNSGKMPGGGRTEMKVAFRVEGELLWDVEEGHFHACKMESKVTLRMIDTRKVERGSESHDVVRTTEFEGESEFTAAIGG